MEVDVDPLAIALTPLPNPCLLEHIRLRQVNRGTDGRGVSAGVALLGLRR